MPALPKTAERKQSRKRALAKALAPTQVKTSALAPRRIKGSHDTFCEELKNANSLQPTNFKLKSPQG